VEALGRREGDVFAVVFPADERVAGEADVEEGEETEEVDEVGRVGL